MTGLEPVVAAALISGGTAVAGGALSSRAAGKAGKAQTAANDAALAYQREQDAKAEARQKEIDTKAEAQWNAEQAKSEARWNEEQSRLAPLRALKEALAGGAAERMGLPFNSAGLSAPRGYPGAQGASAGVSPLSALSSMPGVSRGTTSPALPDATEISEEDPYTTSSLRLADIARGGWRL